MRTKSVLVTGANGQLGTALRNISAGCAGFKFYFMDVDTLDICDKLQLEKYMRLYQVHTIVNCAAYTDVDKAEDDADSCMRINCDAVRKIGEVAFTLGTRVIHLSTDYVFDGKSTRPYRENDAVNPVSMYGRSKLAGEQALWDACRESVIIRTAWLYSETGTNFVKTMLRLGAERDTLGVVADQKGTPTCVIDLAEAIKTILTAEDFVPGIYHYTNEGECTWYDFSVKIFELAGIKCKVNPLTKAEYPVRALRPAYSVLDKTKIKKTYGLQIPVWEESLERFLKHSLRTNE